MDRNKRITKPKYEIIKEALLERIRTGQFSSDAVFCTEKMLSEQYEVSRITAKRAIEDLEQQGILYRKRGVGSFVSQKIPPVSSSASENDSKSKMVSLLLPFATTQGNISETIGSLSAALAEKGYFLSIHITGFPLRRNVRHWNCSVLRTSPDLSTIPSVTISTWNS